MEHPESFGPPPAPLLETRRIRATCEPERIGLVNSIIDAYEGLAVVRTVDAGKGLLEFWVSGKDESTLRLVLQELSKQVDIHIEENEKTEKE